MPASFTVAENDLARMEIAKRAEALGITGNPDKAVHALGKVTLADGTITNAFVMHAADPVITNGSHVVVIQRTQEPSKGKAALPGGMLDPVGEGVEDAIIAARREAMEEAGIDLLNYKASLIGTRRMDRPFDVRMAHNDHFAVSGINQGDVFLVSTQAVKFEVPDLATIPLKAGDDAAPRSARTIRVDDLKPESFGPPDHYDLVMEALGENR